MVNIKLFGRLVVVLVGDTAQLPAVKRRALWEIPAPSSEDPDSLAGRRIYFNHFTSIGLQKIKRGEKTGD